MADLETTQSKLRSTPTAGVSGEHSAYYRRLLSAGYKGYIQGSIGGGTLYGAIGLGIGALVALPLLAVPGVGIGALMLIPALGGTMGVYGAHAFADIGKTAAIIADSADTNEKRRYLLDRYYETPNEEEAKEIRRQLETAHQAQPPEKPFHWKPAIIGIAIGITLAVLATTLGPAVGLHIFGSAALEAVGLSHAMTVLAGAAIGGLTGSVIGIDREYIRRWLDKAEFAVHEPSHATGEIAAREKDIQRLSEAARRGESMASTAGEVTTQKIHVGDAPSTPSLERRSAPISPEMIAGVKEKPANHVHDAVLADRIAGMQQAVQH